MGSHYGEFRKCASGEGGRGRARDSIWEGIGFVKQVGMGRSGVGAIHRAEAGREGREGGAGEREEEKAGE
jgi:hypothetical protein